MCIESENSKSERSFVENEKIWFKPNPGMPWKAAAVAKCYGNAPVYDVLYDGKIVKKHVDSIKPRIRPVICLDKQKLPQDVKDSLRKQVENTKIPANTDVETVLRRSERLALKARGTEISTHIIS